MKWTDKANKDLLLSIEISLGKFSSDELSNAINTAYQQIGVDPITTDVLRFISRRVRIGMVMELLVETDHFDEASQSYWIDLQGKFKVTLP